MDKIVPLNAHVDLNVLMRSLYARRHEAVTVPFEDRSISTGPPLEHQCYVNNDRCPYRKLKTADRDRESADTRCR